MVKQTVFALAISVASVAPALAQECLHGQNESPDQASRRRDALHVARTINSIQANQPGVAKQTYLRQVDLANSPYVTQLKSSSDEFMQRVSLNPADDVLPGWKLNLDLTDKGYWFIVKDSTDPCGFAFVSNQAGSILTATALR